MALTELEKYLHEQIPMSEAMQVSVVEVKSEAVVLSAPLAPNINHRETVFGGSASAVAIVAAWSLLHIRLKSSGISSRLVIQRNIMNYDVGCVLAFRPLLAADTYRGRVLTSSVAMKRDCWMQRSTTMYKRHRFPPEIIQFAVCLYHRVSLSHRDVEDLLAERGSPLAMNPFGCGATSSD